MIRRLSTRQQDFDQQLSDLTSWHETLAGEVQTAVDRIVDDVMRGGDRALLKYCRQFDDLQADTVADLELKTSQLDTAVGNIAPQQREALQVAADRIRQFHQHQLQDSWQYVDEMGNLLGQKVTPVERVGMYVPGGKASYPSSVLMNAIPAKVAGVSEIIMVVPAPGGEINDMVLAAAAIAGVDRVFTIGGAQAVAALAYGTETVPAVDKIVGPGNVYVAAAKRRVFGQVGIDMVAGPSEILIIADGVADPDWVAMDLFSQAEHDENAQSLLLCPDPDYLDAVADSISRLLPEMGRREIIATSLAGRGAMIQTTDLAEAVAVSNRVAPEHLELCVREPQVLLEQVRHAGAIFMGPHTTETLGDYCAGTNHVLPTSGSARFSSSLGVYDFQKRSSLIMCSEAGVQKLGRTASILARSESLTAHARSAELRLHDD